MGALPGGSIVTPTGEMLKPYGRTLEVSGRPVDAELSPDGKRLFVKDMGVLRVVDTGGWKQLQELPNAGGASIYGMALSRNGSRVFVTSSTDQLRVYEKEASGSYKLGFSVKLPGPKGAGNSFPCGVALSADERTAYVALSRNNSLGVVDLESSKVVREIPVGIAPYDVLRLNANMLAVTNQGGRHPRPGEETAPSADTPTPVNENGTAKTGSLSLVDLGQAKEVASIETGLQPTQMVRAGNALLVANANSDTLSVVDLATRKRLRDVVLKPDAKLPFGSMPCAIALSPDRKSAYVTLAGNNAVAMLDLKDPRQPKVTGFIPTGWYPVGVVPFGNKLYVLNNKGIGSRTRRRPEAQGWNSHDHRGSLQWFSLPSVAAMKSLTARVNNLGQYKGTLAAYERSGPYSGPAVPIPAKLGQPSVFKHVIYVIKENRTYDQILGDMPQGDGDPRLCTFGRELSPNHHALAEQFVLLDNYYCNGVLSADGHSWATEGNVTPYLDRAFGGFNRSYTFGDDPITYSSSGFIWDQFLGAGLSFRNYGEMDYAEPPAGMDYFKQLEALKNDQKVVYEQKIGIARLRRYSSRDYPGWNMAIPDIVRMDRFLREFREFETNGNLPNLTMIYLPQDHFGGPVTSAAHMADNDLAIGMLVEAVSKSRFWKETVIFINEDDPQNGYDHVDGRRSICLVVSPYTKRKAVVSEFYNQTSVLRTMLHIFGLPPMNQRDASSPLMTNCFTNTPDFTPYQTIVPKTPVDQKPPARSLPEALWAVAVQAIPLKKTGLKTAFHDELLNRAIWHEQKGYFDPYPYEWAGAHGRGLAGKKLKPDPVEDKVGK